MEEIVEIKALGITRLGNGQHVNFHRSAYDLVNEYEPAKIGITEPLKAEWNGHIDTEEDINCEATADILTRAINKKDEERDKLIIFIFMMVRGYRYSPDLAEVDAAERLQIILSPYGKLQRLPFNDETSRINGLLTDLKKPGNAALVTTLRLTSAVNKLEAANAEFHDLSLQSVKAVRRSNLPSAAAVRPKTDAVYDRIIFMIRAAYLSGAAPVDKEAIKTLVQHLNNLVDKVNANYRQILAERRAAAEKKPKKPKDPKDPKKPGDTEQPTPKPGGGSGSGDDIQVPSEPPKKPEGQ